MSLDRALARLSALLPGGVAVMTAEDGPAAPGAYALLIRLADPLPFRGHDLAPGLYVYAGSARGPGGLRARLARHLRRDKTLRWHVDWLTAAGDAAALALPDGSECGIVARLAATPGFGVPVKGFGASDCRTCPAHLLRWDGAPG